MSGRAAALMAALLLAGAPALAAGLRLEAAYMCEDMTDAGPQNRAVVFSAAEGKIFCFCYFENVTDKTAIYHDWYHGDRLVTRRRLTAEPPAWKGHSSMQLRETDKGPWRVEIIGPANRRLDVIRFSVTD